MEIERPNIGDIIYFTGYGMVEELKIYKITTEETADEFTGHIFVVRYDGTTECIAYDEFGKIAFRDKTSAEKALNNNVSNSISSLENTASICTLQMNTFNSQCCPYCGESYYMENNSMSTCVYYPPIFKNGVNINPDRNTTTVNCTCMACGKEFSYTR
jgi:hypothetical protein